MKSVQEMQDKIKRKFDIYTSDVLKVYNLNKDIRYQISLLDSLDIRLSKHSENVANIANKLCNYLNLNQNFIEYVATCAYIHDIGKLYIPPSIAKKPIKDLNDEELHEYKKHCDIGFNICRKNNVLNEFLAGPYYHHEELDGSGFPQGLTAKDIPFEAKIIAVANMYEHYLNDYNGLEKRIDILKEMKQKALRNKIDRVVFKALIKFVRNEMEFEIYNLTTYTISLKNEIDRFNKALKHYNLARKVNNYDKQQYHKLYSKGYLTNRENIEDIPQYLKNAIEAENLKKQELAKLKKEFSQIKRFR